MMLLPLKTTYRSGCETEM